MKEKDQHRSFDEKFRLVVGKEGLILSLLANGCEQYGLEMVKNSRGQLKRGTIYVFLHRMEEQGLVTSRLDNETKNPGGPRRKYRIEALGRRALIVRQSAQEAYVSFEVAPAT